MVIDDKAKQILQERARHLAQVAEDRPLSTLEVLAFRLADEQYAADLRCLQAVQRAPALTPVPCTPAYVAGLLNVRGEILTVLALAVMLGLAPSSVAPDAANVLLVDFSGRRVGLLVDELLGVRHVELDKLHRPLVGGNGAIGIAGARIVLLDLPALLLDDSFDVWQEVD